MPTKVLKNACIECGGDITVEWSDPMSKSFALCCDVCPTCYNKPQILSKKEWAKKYVIRWEGIKNCDTRTVEGGYLFVRDNDGSVTGLGTRNVSSRAEAIAYHYGLYAEAQANKACSGLAGTARLESEVAQPANR